MASIVNAVGNDVDNCGYWTANGTNNAVILITWDDWGGWFDHVTPPIPSAMGGYFNTNGTATPDGDWYTYGFRVPLLVVSPYTMTTTNNGDGYTGYISGPTDANGNPVNEKQPYYHDFGSILGYIESLFVPGVVSTGGIAQTTNYPFADYFAPDGPFECIQGNGCGTGYPGYPLSDFFGSKWHAYQNIGGATYPSSCFTPLTVGTTSCLGSSYGQDPDNDGVDVEN